MIYNDTYEKDDTPYTPDMAELKEKNEIDEWMQTLKINGLTEEQKQTRLLYSELERVLDMAWDQAANGKGKERHANGKPFEKQDICTITRDVGRGFPTGQALKKIKEGRRLSPEAAIREDLGAINYLAADILYLEEKIKADRLLKAEG